MSRPILLSKLSIIPGYTIEKTHGMFVNHDQPRIYNVNEYLHNFRIHKGNAVIKLDILHTGDYYKVTGEMVTIRKTDDM